LNWPQIQDGLMRLKKERDKMALTKRAVFLFFLLVLLPVACQGNTVKVHIRFNDVQGLVKGHRVISQGQQVGKVTEVKYTPNGDFVVDVLVPEQFHNRLTDNARFYIISDPEYAGKKAIEVVQTESCGKLLDNGATVEGSPRTADLIDDLMTDMQKGLGQVESQVQEFLESLRKLPEKEEIRRLREEINKLTEQMKGAGKSAKEKLQKKILPKIEEEIERLKKRLRKLGKEKEIEPLEVDLKELKKI